MRYMSLPFAHGAARLRQNWVPYGWWEISSLSSSSLSLTAGCLLTGDEELGSCELRAKLWCKRKLSTGRWGEDETYSQRMGKGARWKGNRERMGRRENASGSTLKCTAGEYKSESAFFFYNFFFFESKEPFIISKKKQLPFGYNDAGMMMFCRKWKKKTLHLTFCCFNQCRNGKKAPGVTWNWAAKGIWKLSLTLGSLRSWHYFHFCYTDQRMKLHIEMHSYCWFTFTLIDILYSKVWKLTGKSKKTFTFFHLFLWQNWCHRLHAQFKLILDNVHPYHKGYFVESLESSSLVWFSELLVRN